MSTADGCSLGRGEADARDAPVQRHQHSTQCSLAGRLSAGVAPNPCPQHRTPHLIREQAGSANPTFSFWRTRLSTSTRRAIVYAKSQIHGVRGRCSLPSYVEKQLQQQQRRPPAHAMFYVFVHLPPIFISPMFYITLFWQETRYICILSFISRNLRVQISRY